MYAALADFGLKAIQGINAGKAKELAVEATNIVNDANAYASNIARTGNNTLGVARNRLARYTQGVNNRRALENTANEVNVAAMNYRRIRDSSLNDSFEQQIQLAEQAGAQAAAGAMSGLTGGVADLVAGTTALRAARINQRIADAQQQGDWDASQKQAQILQAGWDSLDHSEITDDLDYGVDVAVKTTYAGNRLEQIMGKQDMKNVADLASGAKAGLTSLANKFSFFQSDSVKLTDGSSFGV